MDQTQLQQKIAEYYQKLPKETQEVFSSMHWLETLQTISKKYGLNEEQIQTLGTETTLVLLGIIHLDEYEEILIKEIKISEESIEKMILEINDSILKTIRPQLAEVFNKNNKLINGEGLDERFDNLSKEARDAIEKSDYQTKIYEIGQKYNLTISQMGVLGESTIKVMLGITPPDKFEESLKELKISAEKIIEIVNDINNQILKKIREELVKNINQNKEFEKKESRDLFENSLETREELLEKIENPEPTKSINNYELRITNEEKEEKPITNDESQIDKKDKEDAISNDQLRITNLEEEKDKTQSILEQKLSGTFKVPKTETDHSLTNVTKNDEGKKVDPYREPTE
ncbi:MAG: hypothetical protein WCW87_04355 [Candidatus Paceibacterota bacterium]